MRILTPIAESVKELLRRTNIEKLSVALEQMLRATGVVVSSYREEIEGLYGEANYEIHGHALVLKVTSNTHVVVPLEKGVVIIWRRRYHNKRTGARSEEVVRYEYLGWKEEVVYKR